ncbi:Crp/Fnr family transcriptional regulator [soil metagenome]
MPGSIRKVIAGRWDSPFMARLKRLVDLTPADVEALRALIECDTAVEKRRDLVVDGYQYSKLSFVKEGVAARYKVLRNGKRQIINILVPGDIVGLPGSFLDLATYSVIALTDMKLEVCALDAFVAACYQRPKFALVLSWLAVHEATTYAERVVDIGRRTAVERLAHFLLDFHARLRLAGRASEFGFDMSISQEVMSDALGLSVPHVNRMMAKLRQDGMIAVAERRVEFTDIGALQRLAQFQPARLSRIPAPVGVKQGLTA